MADWKTFIKNEKHQWMTEDEKIIHFEEISYDEALKIDGYVRAAHAFLFARDPELLRWSTTDKKYAAILMQNRFDGQIGFPGGIADDGPNELPVVGLNRELEEEINFDVSKHALKQEDFLMANVNHKKKLVTFFYGKEVTIEEAAEIERRTLQAMDWGHETMGMLRVPLIHLTCNNWARAQGLPLFLTNRFAGNAKLQLLQTIEKLNIVPKEEFEATMQVYMNYCKPKETSEEQAANGKS